MRCLHFVVARITVETTTPMTIGTGGGDLWDDSICVQDANGLPVIPGSSIAGALRHALADRNAASADLDPQCRSLFGFQEAESGESSRIEVSWAQPHGTDDRPCSLDPCHGRHDDALIDFLAVGIRRDHVRINERGVAHGRQKFDERLVPAGARFTFECKVHDPADGELDTLLGLLSSPGFRLGGRTRRGYGAFEIRRLRIGRFDLTREEDRARFSRLSPALEDGVPDDVLPSAPLLRPPDATGSTILLDVEPEDFWIIGLGDIVRSAQVRDGKEADIRSVFERRIVWKQQDPEERGAVSDEPFALVPASAIKGALRHRTAFHVRRLRRAWCTATPEDASEPVEVAELFGEVLDHHDRGQRGHLLLEDQYLPLEPGNGLREGWLDHVSIDRFTQGPVDRMLFSEAPLYGGRLRIRIDVDRAGTALNASKGAGAEPGRGVAPLAWRALRCAIDDLIAGRLAIGGGANRGHGYLRGSITSGADWLRAAGGET